jgi:protein-disulfide isomerase
MPIRSWRPTSDRTGFPERLVFLSAGLGAAGSLGSVAASWWALAGQTPVFVFERFGSLRAWRSGEIYMGLPLEFWTLAWFVGLAAVALLAPTRVPRLWQAGLLLSAICLISLAGAHAWDARLMNWPLNVMAIAGIGLLGAASRTFEGPAMKAPRHASPMVMLLSILMVVTIAVGGHLMRLRLQEVPARAAAESNFLRWFEDARSRSQPPAISEVTIEVFNDYQCPFCAVAVPRIASTVEKYRAVVDLQLRLWLRDFPLDPACNPGLTFGPHHAACEAAVLARFSAQSMSQEAHAEVLEWVYAQGRELSVNAIHAYLDERGLTRQFDQVRDDLLRDVVADVVSGLRNGVRATPTVLVDGVRLPNHIYLEPALRSLSTLRH